MAARNINYEKLYVAGGYKGFQYEIKLTCLLFHRLLNSADIKEFYLASNYKNVGGFDDLCIRAEVKGHDRPIFIFVQTKHVDGNKKLKNPKINFEDTLKKIVPKFKVGKTDRDFFNALFNKKDVTFILYTPASKVEPYLPPEVEETENINNIVEKLLDTGNHVPKAYLYNGVLIKEYKCQIHENEIDTILMKEIAEIQQLDSNYVKPDERTIFLHYLYNMEEWWKLKGDSPLLTKGTDLYRKAISDIVHEPFMTQMQNGFYMNNIEYFKYDFADAAMDSILYILKGTTHIVVSDVITLASIKVICLLRNNGTNAYSVLSLDRMSKLSINDLTSLIDELRCTNKVLIVICDSTKTDCISHEMLLSLKDATKSKKIIVITDVKCSEAMRKYFEPADVRQDSQTLMDLSQESQEAILNDAKVTFQGQELSLSLLVKKHPFLVKFVKGGVLNKILRNITVSIGKSNSDVAYEEIKDLYIDRKVKLKVSQSNNYKYYLVRQFSDIQTDVVLLTAEPGMGKSTLLTHLSNTTSNSELYWMVKINFLKDMTELEKWQPNRATLDTTAMLKIICQATLINYEKGIQLQESNIGVNYVDEYKGNVEATLELNLFLNFYNEKKVIFVFDGFDEICPHHKERVLDFLTVVRDRACKKQMWVSSRPYSDILPDLVNILGKPYELVHFYKGEQREYLDKLWHYKNIRVHFESLSEEERGDLINTLLFAEIPRCNREIITIQDSLVRHLNLTLRDRSDTNANWSGSQTLLDIPLMLYLFADHISDFIINFEPNKLNFKLNLNQMYKSFTEKKLKNIYFEDKCEFNTSKPKVKKMYDEDLDKTTAMYKMIGAYAIFQNSIFNKDCNLEEFSDMTCNKENREEIETRIRNFKGEEDLTGLITCVRSDNIPIFIHKTFAEYFSSEYICDILKSNIAITKKQLVYSAVRVYNNDSIYETWIDDKRQLDKELDHIIKVDIESSSPLYGSLRLASLAPNGLTFNIEQTIRLHKSTLDDYEADMQEFIDYFNDHKRYIHVASDIHGGLAHILLIYRRELLARMKPHLKMYFPEGSSYIKTPMREVITEIEQFVFEYDLNDSDSLEYVGETDEYIMLGTRVTFSDLSNSMDVE